MTVKNEWVFYEQQVREMDPNFLQQDHVKGSMFQSDRVLFEREYDYILENNEDYLALFESPSTFGSPVTFFMQGKTYNPNDIHHLYHICRYENTVGEIIDPINVFEWGGGYGNMCKVMYMLYGDLIESYTIVDLPKFNRLSENYISNTWEDAEVTHLSVHDFKDKIEDKYDMFVSTWALSESPIEWTSYLDEHNFLNVDRMLFSLHQCGSHIPFMEESTNLRNVLKNQETIEEEVSVIDGINYYIFK